MNNLITKQSLTMSSREIADITKARHSDVMKSIEYLMSEKAEFVLQGYTGQPYTNTQNKQTYFEYHISKRDSYVVVAQFSPKFTAALVDRWQELETKQAPQLPQTMAQALQLAADQAFQLEAQAPKVAFVDKYVDAGTGNKTFREVCKLLTVKENAFREFLKVEHVMYFLHGSWVAYAEHIDAKRFTTKTGVANDHSYSTAYFTAKGVTWIAGKWAVYQLKER